MTENTEDTESAALTMKLLPFAITLGLPLVGGLVAWQMIQHGNSLARSYILGGIVTMSTVAGAIIAMFKLLRGEPNGH